MRSIALVSCVSQKQAKAAPAAELYTSDWFRKAVAWVKGGSFDEWYILSAKYGLVAPDRRIKPYDETLARMSKADRERWADEVVEQIIDTVGLHPPVHFTVLAGEKYREFLVPELRRQKGYRIDVPLKGKGIGVQKKWLAEHTAKSPPRVRRPQRWPNPFEFQTWTPDTPDGNTLRNAIEEYGTLWFEKAPLRALYTTYNKLGEAIAREEEAEQRLRSKVTEYEGEVHKGTLKQEYVICGKESCHCARGGKGHGPYWYVYWTDKGKTRKRYVGKNPANAPAVLKGLKVRIDEGELERLAAAS